LRRRPVDSSILNGRSAAGLSERHVASNRSCYTFTFINGLVGWIFFDFFKVFLAMLSLPHGNLPSRGIAALIEQAIVEVHSQFANVKR
jgi:hypothetical protein